MTAPFAGVLLLLLATACEGRSRLTETGDETAEPEHLLLLDDMEPNGDDDREFFAWGDGRVGHWVVQTGDHDLVEELVPRREASTAACRITRPGAGSDGTLSAVLDYPRFESIRLVEHRGLVFYARLVDARGRLRVSMANWRTATAASLELAVSPEWERYEVWFDELSPAWDGHVSSIDFVVRPGEEPFELWVDDVSLVCRGECPTNGDD